LKIGRLDGKRHLFALFGPFHLERRGSAQRGIESEVICLALGRAGLDIPAALALRVGTRASPAVAAAQFIECGIELARVESFADFNLFAPIPPVRISSIENTLRLRAL
jgi:hypothetical protein